MALVHDYPGLCKDRITNGAYPLDLLDSMRIEIQKGLDGGLVSPRYLREKLETFSQFVEFLDASRDARFVDVFEGDE